MNFIKIMSNLMRFNRKIENSMVKYPFQKPIGGIA